MICWNEMENRLGLLGKRKKEWKGMGVDDWIGWVKKGLRKNRGVGLGMGRGRWFGVCKFVGGFYIGNFKLRDSKTEISELVSEFVLDGILKIGKLGGGKAKSGIIGI